MKFKERKKNCKTIASIARCNNNLVLFEKYSKSEIIANKTKSRTRRTFLVDMHKEGINSRIVGHKPNIF